MTTSWSRRRFLKSAQLLAAPALLAACGQSVSRSTNATVFEPGLFDPTDVPGVTLPEGYFRSWGRDRIRPVYEPNFVSAGSVGWPDEELVIGVNINGQQRAYPVGFLSSREIVIDQIDDIPLLVTW